jgi:peptidoglycan hydrolase-like amidase
VNDSDTSTSTNQAVDDTSGISVTRDCAHPAKALYSAEQNGCYCANGYAGRPGYNWPCITDMVCAGYSCNGHGMGMCQWGTQRHAANQGWYWTTITDHYFYNGGGLRNARRSNTCP